MIKVAQCWDDGVYTDVRLIELLKKYKAKATFNLCPGFMQEESEKYSWAPLGYKAWSHNGFIGGRVGKKDLLDVYGDFKVASHCWNHETAGWVEPEAFAKGAVDARKFLEDVFQKECPGFAWPCGQVTDDAIKVLEDNGFAYARTVANVENPKAYKSPFRLDANCHFMNRDFWAKFQKAKADNVEFFYFWGHSYEMLDCDGLWKQFEDKLAALSADPDVVWVDVVDIVR
ncbi:MAG: polysaccharide deacetylase family protein [Lentisphaeria bacterium]|nr:polysaccharide deacetylase family protein [Lentisphaeria bacterium]